MNGGDSFRRAADGLCDVVVAMEDVDLNALHDEDVQDLLDYKRALGQMTHRYRRDQHAAERREEGDESGGDCGR
ncbi:hypothetical protein ACFQE1_04385 [Halobium palmae]|uniref:Uncharacterized protein n=1 Tax=Halobium palmae TaxID=1776492 RepID=A0ABD5RXZ5_9EURY